MSANDLLILLIQLAFVFLGLLTAIDYFRHRDKTRRDIALMFGAFGIIFVIQLVDRITGTPNEWLSRVSSIALIAQPFLLLRLAGYYHAIPPSRMRAAFILMVVAGVTIIVAPLLPREFALVLSLAIIGYFSAVNGYAMIIFIKGALTTTGVVRHRLRFAAAGSGLLALALLLLAPAALIPTLAEIIVPVALAAILAAALCYYVGFAPPRGLRRAWQLEELRGFLMTISTKPLGERMNVLDGLSELSESARRAVGGFVAAVVQEDEAQGQWTLRYITNHPEWINTAYQNDGIFKEAKREQRPLFFSESHTLVAEDRHLLETFGAENVMVAPIATAQQRWGQLLIFLRHTPLFVQDDLDLLMLLTQQSAIALENSALVEQLNSRSEQLTEQVKQQSQELEESRVEYRRIVEIAQEGIWESDANFQTVFVNPRMAEMLGYSVAEIMAKSVAEFLHPESRANLSTYQRRLQGVREQLELTFVRKDGSTLIALSSSTPLFDENGKYAGSVAMIADITERKQAEQQILKLNTELEQRVIERTAQLSAVNRELEAFSYSVSHDLRAPLRALDGFSQILVEDYGNKLDEEGLKYLERIRAGSQRMGQLIDAMLQLSRLTRVEVQFETVNLSEIARSITTELQEQNPDRQMEVRIQDNLIANGDERMLRAALTNLLNNAWKFTGKQPHPCVEFGATTHNEKFAYYVRDNGVGFDMAYVGKLFGAFQRLHGLNEFEGTGIGLATVERILQRHRGEVWVDAAVNQGATFYFTLNGRGSGNGN